MMHCVSVLWLWAKMYNGAVHGAEHSPFVLTLADGRHKYEDTMWLSVCSMPRSASVCVCACTWSLFELHVSVSMPGLAMVHHPALHLSYKMPHRESPSRAITHDAWPFLNNFINIPWARLNRRVWKVAAWRLTDADSIKPSCCSRNMVGQLIFQDVRAGQQQNARVREGDRKGMN